MKGTAGSQTIFIVGKQMKMCDDDEVWEEGENILISDRYWNSHYYSLHDSDVGVVQNENMQRHSLWKPKLPPDALTLREHRDLFREELQENPDDTH